VAALLKARHFGDRSFRISLRSEPRDAAVSRQPFVDLSFALEPFDVSNFDPRIVSLDLPVTVLDTLYFKYDAGRFGFGHARNMRQI
jgi:hypothetical protein